MTADEMKAIEERLQAAKKHALRVARFEEAIRIVSRETPPQILLSLQPANPGGGMPIQYRNSESEQLRGICWSLEEQGIAEELHQAVLQILRRRLDEAQENYAAV
jgi:hypothetical protein